MRSMAAFGALAVVAAACASSSTKRVPDVPGAETNPALARIARQCSLVASCADAHDSSAFRTPQSCFDWYVVNARDEAPLADCVMRARTCAELTKCTHARADGLAESFCKAHPGVLSACDSDRLLTCEGDGASESTAVDCAALGGTCGERKNGGLVVRGCVAPKTCPPNAPEHRCDGDAVVDCEDGIADRNACPAGSKCVAGTDAYGAPAAHCRSGAGRECSLAGSAFCEGDVAYACVQNGRFAGLHSSDCGAMGLGCVVRSGRVSCTRRGPASCSPDPASCLGDELRFCADGIPFRVSCKEIGMSTCDPAGGGGEALCK
jgi:hypothetical protein